MTNMKDYEVTVWETTTRTYTVTAKSGKEASDRIYHGVWQSGIVRRTIKSVRVVR